MSKLKQKTIQVADCQIHCLQNTDGSKRDVLLLHGAKFSSKTWHELGTLPGFGNSPKCEVKPKEVLQGIIQQEGLDRPVLVGPSLGGAYAMSLYFAHPEMVSGLVLVGTVGVDTFRDRIQEIAVPTLLIWGGQDTVSPLDNAHFLQKQVPNSRLVILEGANHPCYLDNPQKWHEELVSFLDQMI
jgi:pimeloyl-ACP methyl ester carboxylesterase